MATSMISQPGWSKLSYSGGGPIAIPNTALEAIVRVQSNDASKISYSFYLSADMLNETFSRYYSGYGWGGDKNVCEIQLNGHTVYTTNLYNGNTDLLSNSTTTVYYR